MSIVTFDRDQADWGSQKIYPDGILNPFNPDKAVIHWGGSTNPGDSEANEAAVLRAWQRIHLAKQPHPWFDIGYGFGFGNTGLTFRLRGFNRQSSTLGDIDKDGIPANHEAIAFAWIGGSGYVPSSAAFASMGKAIRECQAAIPNFTVEPHSSFRATKCPGNIWREWILDKGWEQRSTIRQPDIEGDMMKQSDTGVNVRKMQNYLNRWADTYNLGPTPLVEDGQYGPFTGLRVFEFQTWANIEQTGDYCWFTASTMAIAIQAETK